MDESPSGQLSGSSVRKREKHKVRITLYEISRKTFTMKCSSGDFFEGLLPLERDGYFFGEAKSNTSVEHDFQQTTLYPVVHV
jgi:hypothetical protein